MPINTIQELAFDHNTIILDALEHMRMLAITTPSLLFNMLPRKFTILQLRTLFSLVQNKELDVRNFHKKLKQMPYVVPPKSIKKVYLIVLLDTTVSIAKSITKYMVYVP